MSYRSRNHFTLKSSTKHQSPASYYRTDAEQAFKTEGCTPSAYHASVRVAYWQEWVKEFEMIFVNRTFTKKKNFA